MTTLKKDFDFDWKFWKYFFFKFIISMNLNDQKCKSATRLTPQNFDQTSLNSSVDGMAHSSDLTRYFVIPAPDQWTVVPLLVKMYKLLINELSNQMENNLSTRGAASDNNEVRYFPLMHERDFE